MNKLLKQIDIQRHDKALPPLQHKDDEDDHQQRVDDGRLNKDQAQHQGGADLALRLGLAGKALGGLGCGKAHAHRAARGGDAHGDARRDGLQPDGGALIALGLMDKRAAYYQQLEEQASDKPAAPAPWTAPPRPGPWR